MRVVGNVFFYDKRKLFRLNLLLGGERHSTMNEQIKVTHGNGVVTEIPAIEILGTSYVQTEKDKASYYFMVFKQGGQYAWKISDFESEESAKKQCCYIYDEYSRIMSL